MQLSIIVPVYNVEPYVKRCVESLMQQDLPRDEYEVIIINDGSPDNSRAIILKLQEEYDNIIFIDQENQGVSVARNNGLAKAVGEYILCIDPDDYITENTLGSGLKQAKLDNLDVLYLGYTIFGADDQVEYKSNYKEISGTLMTGPELYFKSRGKGIRDPDRSVGILYGRSFLKTHNLTYPVDVPYLEDGLFLSKVLCLAVRCSFSDDTFYQRTTRQGSATHSDLIYSDKARSGFVRAALEIRTFGQELQLDENQQNLINQTIAKFILLPLQSCSMQRDFKAYKRLVLAIKNENFDRLSLSGIMNVYAHLGKVLNTSTWLFYNYYFFYARFSRHYENK